MIKSAEQLASSPGSPINEACRDWASTQAAYRPFDNGKATPEAILAPQLQASVKRMLTVGGPVLDMQDTVFFGYGHHPKTRGIGPIGNSNSEHDRGLVMHNALAFTPAGVPLGLLSQNIWSRREVPDEGNQETIERLQCTPIEEKESSKWLQALRETIERAARGAPVITVAARESDIFEFLTYATEQRARLFIRARTDGLLVPEKSGGFDSILDAYAGARVLGTLTVQIPGNGKRKARTAQVQVRLAPVTLKAPQRGRAAKASGSTEPIRVQVIAATETDAPEGQEAISWVLLTNLPVPDFDSAVEKGQWYARRRGIETWHKVLKSGCKVEKCLLETAARLSRYRTLFSIVGVRLIHVAYLARVQPDMPAIEVFSPEEIETLQVRVHRALPPAKSPSLCEAVRMLGSLGGHRGRKCDGVPGMTVIWRGWISLYETVIALRAAREAGLINTSGPMLYCGRNLTAAKFELIHALLAQRPPLTRARLSREVCERLNWRRPDGRLKDMSCRVAMLRMQTDGLFTLPPPRNPKPAVYRPYPHIEQAVLEPANIPAIELATLELDLVRTKAESLLWNVYIERHHYLGHQLTPGAQLRYFVRAAGHIVATLDFGASAWKVKPRDHLIGWSTEQRKRNLRVIINHEQSPLPYHALDSQQKPCFPHPGRLCLRSYHPR